MKKIMFSSNKMNEARKFRRRTQNICTSGKDAASKKLRHKRVTHCIFDVDGTLIDSHTIYTKIMGELCAKYGKPYPDEVRQRLAGVTKRKLCETVIAELKLDVELLDLERQFTEMSRARLSKSPFQKGVISLVTHLYGHKVPMAIATNTTRITFLQVIKEKMNFFEKFHHMVTINDVEVNRGKPEPDLYLLAAAKFPDPPDPSSCLVFEDSTPGLRAALAAKMQVVLTPHKHIIDQQYVNEQTETLTDLREFKPEHYGLPPFAGNSKGHR